MAKAKPKAAQRSRLQIVVGEEKSRAPRGTAEPRDDRQGKALLGAMVPKQALKEFGILAKMTDKKNGELLRELVNDYFEANDRPRIA
jgi:hypothetical protein